jgi:hypothetical protein
MKNLRYISVQPAISYYTWQVEVMIQNFLKHGINPNLIDVICATRGPIPEAWSKLAEHYNTVRFFFYSDDRQHIPYISSVRPHVLKKHFAAHPELKDDVIFYHDCDIVMTKAPDWSKFIDDDIWYMSDTRSYISASYIQSKKFGVYEEMCKIIGIDESVPVANELNSGGAQYIMKNVDAAFWDKVERDSNSLYEFFVEHLKEHPQSDEYHPIQKWTADMWAVLWGAWAAGHKTLVVPEMRFAWATEGPDRWQECTIFHNAGVVVEYAIKDRLFFKGDYQNTLPYNIKLEDFNQGFNTYKYVQEIVETAKTSCLL